MSNAKKATPPSSNWLALQKTLKKSASSNSHPRKRRKLEHPSSRTDPTASLPSTSPVPTTPHGDDDTGETNGLDIDATRVSLRKMVHGTLTYTPTQQLPGRYLAIDCEMVGVGIEGEESSLARVSLVNWYGAVQLDVLVRQRERVVDYRTQWSGIREKDMVRAKPFVEVQKQVADLVKDRILIGHAVHNDLKALLLSHPRQLTRDTQVYARKFDLTKSKYIALRNLVKDQLGLTIQEGEHSSVTDARATMAIYRLHKKEWEKGVKPVEPLKAKKRKCDSLKGKERAQGGEDEPESMIEQRKGISSGISTIIKRRGSDDTTISKTTMRGRKSKSTSSTKSEDKKAWWSELPKSGSKGSIRLETSSHSTE